jgi:hypothetical protein
MEERGCVDAADRLCRAAPTTGAASASIDVLELPPPGRELVFYGTGAIQVV